MHFWGTIVMSREFGCPFELEMSLRDPQIGYGSSRDKFESDGERLGQGSVPCIGRWSHTMAPASHNLRKSPMDHLHDRLCATKKGG